MAQAREKREIVGWRVVGGLWEGKPDGAASSLLDEAKDAEEKEMGERRAFLSRSG